MREAVTEALRAAMKSRDQAATGTLRLISAAIKERDIDARGRGREAAGPDELVATLAKMIRQREEAAKIYEEAGRPELAARERAEIELIRGFLPKQMDEEEMRAAVRAAIAETGAASARDMGRVMALLKERHAGRMDFGKASTAVKSLLS
ncbi:MAG TPA: GatB/YqeY domain-containing protein [Propylenella sp.]|nr:GatB/YqeY domain-containing protein [Propylenella sp.]